jgi:antitoxin component YwqK of YwqJK toxin-antitoxin module
MKNYYKILGLKESASQKEIQSAFERLSKELNPKNNDNQEFFVEEYKKVQEAYKALSNSSILATKKGAKYPTKTPKITTTDKKSAMSPKKNKITKKTKVIFVVLAGIIAIGMGIYMFSGSQSKFSKLKSLVYESQSTRWMKSQISNNIVFVKDNMKPFSGTLSKNRDHYAGSFLEGKKNGTHREYKYGSLIREGRFENGTPVGVHKNWHYNGQLAMEVTFSNGKREGLSKKWNQVGDLLSLDFDQNKILDYMTNYLNSSKKLNIVEGSYDDYDKNEKGYNFYVIKILGRYYAIMTNNFRNGTQNSAPKAKTFYIGDVKAIFSSTQATNKYDGWYFMADKTKEPVTLSYNIIGNSLDFDENDKFSKITFYKN